jgi:hypothetical protein
MSEPKTNSVELWNSVSAYLAEENTLVRLTINTYAKKDEESYADSLAVAGHDAYFTIEGFDEFVKKIVARQAELKAKLIGEVAEVV